MSRARTLVAAVWVVLVVWGLGGSAGAAQVDARDADATADAIDATGATDVTDDLQALFDRTPDGGVIRLAPGADYRLEGTLVLDGRHDLRLEGNGARLFGTTTGDHSRSHLRINGGSNLVVHNLEIQGANPRAGVGERAYVTDLEGQHGIRVEGATDVELHRVNIHDVYGDFVYLGGDEEQRWTEGVWIHDSTFARSGRQGLTVVAGRDVVIEHNTITDVRMGAVDLEPHPSLGAENIHILENDIGPSRLLFVAATGGGRVNTVVVARNTLRDVVMGMVARPPPGERRQAYWIVDNSSDTPARRTVLRFTRLDGVVVTGNRQPVDRPGEALVEVIDSCGVSMGRNDFTPGTLPFTGEGRPCGFDLSPTPPAPPAVAGRGEEQVVPAPPSTTAEPPTTTATTGPNTTTTTGSTTATPSAPSTTPPTSQGSPDSATAAAARDDPGSDGIAVPVVVLAGVVAALGGTGAALAFNARRGRR